MKLKFLFTTSLFLLTVFVFIQCQKNQSRDQDPSKKAELEKKLKSWLDSKVVFNEDREKFEDLKKNLNVEDAYFEPYENGKQFLIVPISTSYESRWNINNSTEKALLLTFSNGGILNSEKLIFYRSGSKKLSEGFFNAFYTKILPGHEFEMTFLTPEGKFISRSSFKDGKQITIANVRKGNPDPTIASVCIARYIVTTIYHWDGTQEEDWFPLGVTCDDGQCPPEVMCLPGDGGGGSTNEGGEESTRLWDWELNNSGPYRVISSETVTANLPNAPYPSGGKIKRIAHNGDDIQNLVPSPHPFTWHRLGLETTTKSYTNSVTVQISGIVKKQGASDDYLSEYRYRDFNSLWP